MAQEITFTKQADGTWQGSFTSTGTRTIVQVERQENAPLYLNISADDGQHNVIYQPPKDFKNQILSIYIAEGALVTIVSHSAVTKAQYIASELDYYTKAEVDEKIGEIYSLEPVVVDTLPTASEDTMKKLYFVPKTGGGETGNVKEEYITVRTVASGSGTEADPYVYSYSWEQVGDTSVQLQADWNQTNTSSADYIKNKPALVEELNDLSDVDITPDVSQQTYFEDAVEDYDGNKYDAVIIGDQVWMAENLRTTHYSDGTAISLGTQTSNSTPYYYHVNNDSSNDEEYGLQYNYAAVMNGEQPSESNPSGVQGIAPNGWHIPSVSEVEQMINIVQHQYTSAAKKISSKTGWSSSSVTGSPGNNPSDNNETGFNAKPAGSWWVSGDLSFGKTAFISCTDYDGRYGGNNKHLYLSYDRPTISTSAGSVLNGKSVRCVCDLSATEFRAKMSLKGRVLMHDGEKWTDGEIPEQQQADWSQSDNTKANYIKNKPTLGTAAEKDVPASGNASLTEVVLGSDTRLLPSVTSTDNGKILIVDNGEWAATEIPVADAILYPNSNS